MFCFTFPRRGEDAAAAGKWRVSTVAFGSRSTSFTISFVRTCPLPTNQALVKSIFLRVPAS